MLILSRAIDQGIVLRHNGKEIGRIVVCRVRGDRVSLGLDLDEDVVAMRDEIANAIGCLPGSVTADDRAAPTACVANPNSD